MTRSNINIQIKRPYATSYVLKIATFALSITGCKIITYELQMYLIRLFDLKMKVEDVGDSDENRPANLLCQTCIRLPKLVHPDSAVCSRRQFVVYLRADVRTQCTIAKHRSTALERCKQCTLRCEISLAKRIAFYVIIRSF